jgi:trans-aconitate methyltransferase
VHIEDAVALIRSAVERQDGVWIDFGAGRGTFTRALVQVLEPGSKVVAIDRDPEAVTEIQRWASEEHKDVRAIAGDFSGDFALDLSEPIAGMLFANSLHFVKHAGALLAGFVQMLAPGGRVVLVEYDRRAASRWVPYPIAIASLQQLAAQAGLSKFRVVESRPSNYEGIIYCAVAEKK